MGVNLKLFILGVLYNVGWIVDRPVESTFKQTQISIKVKNSFVLELETHLNELPVSEYKSIGIIMKQIFLFCNNKHDAQAMEIFKLIDEEVGKKYLPVRISSPVEYFLNSDYVSMNIFLTVRKERKTVKIDSDFNTAFHNIMNTVIKFTKENIPRLQARNNDINIKTILSGIYQFCKEFKVFDFTPMDFVPKETQTFRNISIPELLYDIKEASRILYLSGGEMCYDLIKEKIKRELEDGLFKVAKIGKNPYFSVDTNSNTSSLNPKKKKLNDLVVDVIQNNLPSLTVDKIKELYTIARNILVSDFRSKADTERSDGNFPFGARSMNELVKHPTQEFTTYFINILKGLTAIDMLEKMLLSKGYHFYQIDSKVLKGNRFNHFKTITDLVEFSGRDINKIVTYLDDSIDVPVDESIKEITNEDIKDIKGFNSILGREIAVDEFKTNTVSNLREMEIRISKRKKLEAFIIETYATLGNNGVNFFSVIENMLNNKDLENQITLMCLGRLLTMFSIIDYNSQIYYNHRIESTDYFRIGKSALKSIKEDTQAKLESIQVGYNLITEIDLLSDESSVYKAVILEKYSQAFSLVVDIIDGNKFDEFIPNIDKINDALKVINCEDDLEISQIFGIPSFTSDVQKKLFRFYRDYFTESRRLILTEFNLFKGRVRTRYHLTGSTNPRIDYSNELALVLKTKYRKKNSSMSFSESFSKIFTETNDLSKEKFYKFFKAGEDGMAEYINTGKIFCEVIDKDKDRKVVFMDSLGVGYLVHSDGIVDIDENYYNKYITRMSQ